MKMKYYIKINENKRFFDTIEAALSEGVKLLKKEKIQEVVVQETFGGRKVAGITPA